MNNLPDIDEILSKLSLKFNRIFYEKEFVECVNEDLQLLANTNNKCVLVFPVLGPNYLKALRYQARICDFGVVSIGTGFSKSVAVCRKKYLLIEKSEDKIERPRNELKMPELDSSIKGLKKKRPERQLYVPPAQRKSRLSEENVENKVQKRTKNEVKTKKVEKKCVFSLRSVTKYLDYPITYVTCKLDKNNASVYDNYCKFRKYLNIRSFTENTVCIFELRTSNDCLYLLDDYRLLWQPSSNFFLKDDISKTSANYETYPIFDLHQNNENEPDLLTLNIFNSKSIFPIKYLALLSHFFEETLNLIKFFGINAFKFEYKFKSDIDTDDCVIDMSNLQNGHFLYVKHNSDFYVYDCNLPHNPIQCYKDIKSQGLLSNNTLASTEVRLENAQNIVYISQNGAKYNDHSLLEQNNIRNNCPKEKSGKNEHEEEKEIMRTTKKKINRKTRPIIKYVDDDNNTLKIGKEDNVNNWEDLFDDEGQLHEEYFNEISQKVGPNVKIVKAVEDYTSYAAKPPEEFEHMVELYDFPSTFETQDIITAFLEIQSDSMYVKWVDDTHALLVLGSSHQAKKALQISNPFIKVRPMSIASSIALAKANKSDLRPAMKRPPTNLQTARRLITSHLGAKSKVTREQSAKEREDLKAARELKRLMRRNEQAAWDGNLKSTL